MNKKIKRKYNITDSELSRKCKNIILSMRRDIEKFSVRMITESHDIAPFVQEVNSFDDMFTDEELLGAKMQATESKLSTANTVKIKIGVIINAAERTYGKKSSVLKQFGTNGIHQMNNIQLLACIKKVARTTNKLLTNLSKAGITKADVDELLALATKFDDEIEDQDDAVNDRNIAKEERIIKGNLLYDKLVMFANTGKNIWRYESEAKYNDYVLFDKRKK